MGRTPYLQPVHVTADAGLIGQVRDVAITAPHRQQPARGARLNARRRDTTTLEFPDNKLLAALGGPHARHFARLEQKLNVGIDMRGNLVAIDGKERERAGAILRALYTRLEAGESVTQAEVDAEIRFTDGARANAPGADQDGIGARGAPAFARPGRLSGDDARNARWCSASGRPAPARPISPPPSPPICCMRGGSTG